MSMKQTKKTLESQQKPSTIYNIPEKIIMLDGEAPRYERLQKGSHQNLFKRDISNLEEKK